MTHGAGGARTWAEQAYRVDAATMGRSQAMTGGGGTRQRSGASIPQLSPQASHPSFGDGPHSRCPQLFHPAVASWFSRRFPDGPTEPQAAAWPLIAEGRDVLVASPTGTGKTLTGFLVAIDRAYRSDAVGDGARASAPCVLYVSPLRALAVDVQENLQAPLAQIAAAAEEEGGLAPLQLRVAVRTGDTSSAARAAMRRHPPDLMVTTPESLYLLLTAASSRALLRHVRAVIVDEVHTLARDKRGAHLALSLERLAHLVEEGGGRLQRIGLSATQRPLTTMARLLGGVAEGREAPTIVDCGHLRDVDVDMELPPSELEAVASQSQLDQVLDRLAELVAEHRTTLVFVNTRRMSERLAHLLAERLEQGGLRDEARLRVAAHHGSLSAHRRRVVEARLRAGELRALVATASLELGIDIGPVDLVCQIGSPRSIATFLQRVGRANHQRGGVPKGRVFPLTRDELVECTALLAATRAGDLDTLHPVRAPLDVLAQQVVAEVAAAGECGETALYDLVRRAAPFAELDRAGFDDVVEMVSSGIVTGRGRRGAYVHRDGVHGLLRPRRGARLAALTNGGTIPETGDYRVVADPDGATVGSVHEDFAVEAAIGDVFLLGTHAWRVRKVETGRVRVEDAAGAAPSVPFWFGEAPARTVELSRWVGALRQHVEQQLTTGGEPAAKRWLRGWAGVGQAVAGQVVTYLDAARSALGVLPTHERVVVERFFDDSEGMQLVVHAPFGGAINRAFGLALRKRFCVTFDFELQAAADDDAVLVSLGPQHSFPLSEVPGMVRASRAVQVLTQAVLPHPMLQARWRWNANRALVVPRTRGGQRRPVHLQRMEADDLLAAAWPSLAACQDNAPPGPITVPDHVLVRQTVDDCLHEALDADGLVALLRDLQEGRIGVTLVESVEPSPLAHGILSGRPYTFLDGAPLEERRSRAVALRRGLPADAGVSAEELGPLDGEAARQVLEAAAPRPRDADELHDVLLSLVLARPVEEWKQMFAELAAARRAFETGAGWVAAEQRELAAALEQDEDAVAECVRGHLEVAGPVSQDGLAADAPLPSGSPRGAPVTPAQVRAGLALLERRGVAVQLPDGRWCARRLLARLHVASRSRRRSRVHPASVADFVRFLCRWQHVAPGSRLEGRSGLLRVVRQLQGLEIAVGEWERSVLPARVVGYEPRWLDELCLSGEVAWGRLGLRDLSSSSEGHARPQRRGAATPSPATPLGLVVREDLPWMLHALRLGETASEPEAGVAADVLGALRRSGPSFRAELPSKLRRLPQEVDEGLWELVARGLATADAFSAVRSLLRAGRSGTGRRRLAARSGWARRSLPGSGIGEGRWALLGPPEGSVDPLGPMSGPETDPEALAEAVAGQLLDRWGVVLWELWGRESFRVPWRNVVKALRRMEARGIVLGGRFVGGLSGEQYAWPEAYEVLTGCRRAPDPHEIVDVAGVDPLNVTGVVLPGPRVSAIRHRRVLYRAGQPILEAASGCADGSASR